MAPPPRDPAGLVGGVYGVDFSQPLPGAPPHRAFAATRAGQPGQMAVAVARGWPARPRALSVLAGIACPGMLGPLAHGPAATPSGETGYFVICPAPPGPALALRPWSEAALLEHLLKPAAAALSLLHARNLTHRAIRPDNLFQAGPNAAVTLGCAWAAPPACHQPAWLEPPASAACLPTGRGDGTIADDVYALGAVMVMLALGADPVAGIPDGELQRRKLEFGSYAAIVGKHRLPSALVDLLRGMLADDAEHRPSPALLSNPAAARSRRIASRPPRRAQRPLELGGHTACTSRLLAHALQAAPADGVARLREGAVGSWLRRGLGDGVVAGQIDAIVQQREAEGADGTGRADPLLITRAIAALEPAAPLTWRSVTVWPDGLGPALDHALHHAPDLAPLLAEIMTARVPQAWQEWRGSGPDAGAPRLRDAEMRDWALAGAGAAGPLRLRYGLNPLAPCASPATARAWVIRLADLLPALEADCDRPQQPGQRLIDAEVAAFIEARRDERLDADINRLAAVMARDDVLSQLRLLARLQAKLGSGAFPRLCLRAVEAVQPLLDRYRSRSRREQIAGQMATMAQAGQLTPIVSLLDDGGVRARDDEGFQAAQARVAAIDAMLGDAADDRSRLARRVSRELVEGAGLLACVVALGVAVFS